MNEHIQAIVTVLSLVNPAICGMMFVQAESGTSRSQRLVDATKVTLVVLVILVVAALVGTRLLHLFGVSLDDFRVAGGGVLAWMGFSMLSGRSAAVPSVAAGSHPDASLTPLILFAASPGTVRGDYTLGRAHAAETPGHGPASHCSGDGVHVAGNVAVRADDGQTGQWWIHPGHDDTPDGINCSFHGGAVHPHGLSRVHGRMKPPCTELGCPALG